EAFRRIVLPKIAAKFTEGNQQEAKPSRFDEGDEPEKLSLEQTVKQVVRSMADLQSEEERMRKTG
ncbi:unnamed protein product, partial [Amoebophrya sp. A25]